MKKLNLDIHVIHKMCIYQVIKFLSMCFSAKFDSNEYG